MKKLTVRYELSCNAANVLTCGIDDAFRNVVFNAFKGITFSVVELGVVVNDKHYAMTFEATFETLTEHQISRLEACLTALAEFYGGHIERLE